MSRGVNKVILVGNLGDNPEVRQAGDNIVANIRVATSESWKNKSTGEREERTEWHRVCLFGKLGEIAEKYLSKGDRVYIEGRTQTRKWEGKDGTDQYTTEIVASEMVMLSAPREAAATQSASAKTAAPAKKTAVAEEAPAETKAPTKKKGPAKKKAAPVQEEQAEESVESDFNDDVPF